MSFDPKKIGLVPKLGDERSLRATKGSEAISQEIRLRLPRRCAPRNDKLIKGLGR